MKPLDQPEELRSYYEDPEVVETYLRRRTGQPLNGVLHRAEVRFLNAALRERAPRCVLEIAPGPARLTAEMHWRGRGVVVDASPGMLAAARARLRARGLSWEVVRGDAFTLPFSDGQFDLVYTLKFVRHFQADDRRRLYEEIRRVLHPKGAFVMDAQNRAVSLPHRTAKGLGRYPIYDVLYDRTELIAEMEAAGFRVVRIAGILEHFAAQQRLNRLRHVGLTGVATGLIEMLERLPGGNPSTWMVLNEVA